MQAIVVWVFPSVRAPWVKRFFAISADRLSSETMIDGWTDFSKQILMRIFYLSSAK